MRLIDADRLKIVLRIHFGQTGAAAVLPQIIDAQPTVYDVNKVVEQLEELKDTERDDGVVELITTRVWNRSISKAIEIVKNGSN